MNCKPGDMAVAIKANFPENVGLIVTVTRRHETLQDTWVVEPAWPVSRGLSSDDWAMTRPRPGMRYHFLDAWLRPIRPGDLSDDTVTDKTLEIA